MGYVAFYPQADGEPVSSTARRSGPGRGLLRRLDHQGIVGPFKGGAGDGGVVIYNR